MDGQQGQGGEGGGPSAVPPDWYPDPEDPSRVRYWDGTAWTRHTNPVPQGYQAQPGAAEVAVSARSKAVSLVGPARLALILVAFMALLAIIAAAYDISQLTMLSRTGPAPVSTSEAVSGALLATVVYLATVVAFLVWVRRAYFHPALSADRLRFRRGLVVTSWFVPILNLIRPKQIMDDIWRASDPALLGPTRVPDRQPVSGLLHAWWTLWLMDAVADVVVLVSGNAHTASELRQAAVIYVGSDLVGLALVVVWSLLVKRVTRRVQDRAAQLAATATPAAA